MPLISVPFIKSCVTGQFRLPGQQHRAAGRRAGALFFARLLDYFIVTRNSQPLPGLVTVTQLHRDPWLRTSLPGLAKNAAPRPFANALGRLRRHLIKPPGRFKALTTTPRT
jgi:hypothetical protein